MGYAGACSVVAMDDLALVNEKVDTLDEGLGEEVVRVDGINRELTEWVTEFTDERVRMRERDCFLTWEVRRLFTLVDGLVWTMGELRDDQVRQAMQIAALSRREPLVDWAVEDPQ